MPTRSSRSDSPALMRKDIIDQARMISAIVDNVKAIDKAVQELKTDQSIRVERDIRWNERFDGLKAAIDRRFDGLDEDTKEIRTIGRWILAGFGIVILTAVGNFIINGGLAVASTAP